MKDVIIVSGPTATGKTKTSIEIAKLKSYEVVNFDSLVFYHEITIGTAKPTQEEMQNIPHHLVGTHSITSPLNAADFQKEAVQIINDIHKRGVGVVLVGGSGFYLQTLLKGMYKGGSTPSEVTERSNKLYQESGIEPFRNILKESDIENFERYHENDHYRIRRAVEFFWTTGKPFSNERNKMDSYMGPAEKYNWDIKHIHLDIDKDVHFEIIQKRTRSMIELGLIEEVKSLIESDFSKELKPLQSIGYKETIDYIEGYFDSKEEYIERIDISTRQLAKAQRTWFKKMNLKSFNPLKEFDSIIEYINSN